MSQSMRSREEEASQYSPLCGTHLDIKVSTLATDVVQTQRYQNQSDRAIEAIYTFPVPLHATLLGATVVTEGRELRMAVQPRADADLAYEEAIVDGKAAYRLEQTRPGLYTLSAGNLGAGQHAEVKLHWAMLNRWQQGRLALRLPTTLTERYGNATNAGVEEPAIPRLSAFARQTCDVDITVDGTLRPFDWECPSHELEEEESPDLLRIHGSSLCMDRDIVLLMRQPENRAGHYLILPDGDTWTGVAQVFGSPAAEQELRSVILVVDCSGSMAGASISQARAGAAALLDWLRPEQEVNLIRFGSLSEPLFDQPRSATEDTLAELSHTLLETDANMGGTEMASAMVSAARQASLCNGNTDILLLTDGAIWETESAVAALDTRARIFTVGVGFSPNGEATNRLATVGGGVCETVSPNESVADAMQRQYQRICSGDPMELEAKWSGGATSWPASPLLFPGDACLLFASDLQEPDPAPSFKARVGNTDSYLPINAEKLSEVSIPADTLLRLAASERLKVTQSKTARTELAIRYQLVSEETTLVVVDADSQVQAGMPETQVVEHMTPPLDRMSDMCLSAFPSYSRAPERDALDYSEELMMMTPGESGAEAVTTDLPALIEACNDAIHDNDLDALDLDLVADFLDPTVVEALKNLTNGFEETDIVCALVQTLHRHDGSLEVAPAVLKLYLDSALSAAMFRLVRQHHDLIFS